MVSADFEKHRGVSSLDDKELKKLMGLKANSLLLSFIRNSCSDSGCVSCDLLEFPTFWKVHMDLGKTI